LFNLEKIMTKAYDNSILARNINVSKVNTNVSGVLQLNNIDVSLIRSYTEVSNFPASGITNTYYLASDSSRFYQWTGSQYVEMGPALDTISANNITFGTLSDARLSSNVTRNENLRWSMQTTNTSIDWFPRGHGTFGNAAATSTGLILAFFTAPYSFTATTLTFCTGGTATAGLSLCRFGLFTVDETITSSVTASTPVVTLVARTANDTTIGNITNTLYSRAFVSDGLPNSYNLVGGTRYAAGLMIVGTTPGTWQCATLSTGVIMRLPPMVAGFVGPLNDLPTLPISVSNGTFVLYGRIS